MKILATKSKQNIFQNFPIFCSKNFGKKGFTLVEMLIVVVIIGILASALIPRMTNVMSAARDTARLADINALANGLETYYNNEGEYIKNGETSQVAELGVCINNNSMMQGLQKGMIISSLPLDPQKNHRNFGTRNQDKNNNTTAGCLGNYNYVGMNGNKTDSRVPDMNMRSAINGTNVSGLGYNGYVLTFSPENFSKGNYINPTDTAWKVGHYGYSFDWYRNSEFYRQFVCNGKVEYVPISQQTINNPVFDGANLANAGDNCKTNDPQRIIYARFNEN